MDKEHTVKKVSNSWVVVILCTLVYLFLPSTNNVGDAFGYAIDVSKGEDLFYPHHLFYNVVMWSFHKLLPSCDVLTLMCAINALIAGSCLAILRSILRKYVADTHTSCYLLLVGMCWGVLRFATDGEVYLMPIIFSLLATLFYAKKRNATIISLLAAIACLFHQTHFFWWLGLGIGLLRLRPCSTTLFQYISAALIVPVVYVVVYLNAPGDADSFFGFVLHDYFYTNSVGFSLRDAILLTPINFIRTFVQIHGYILPLILHYPAYILGVILALLFLIFFVFRAFKQPLITQTETDNIGSTHILIAALQLLFAFVSEGNSEFMVMIPFALATSFSSLLRIEATLLRPIALFIAIWNLTIGCIPYHFLELSPAQTVYRHLLSHKDHKYVLTDRFSILHRTGYYTPELTDNLIKDIPDTSIFFTDALTQGFVSRHSITKEDKLANNIIILKSDTIAFDLGEVVLSECAPKQNK